MVDFILVDDSVGYLRRWWYFGVTLVGLVYCHVGGFVTIVQVGDY